MHIFVIIESVVNDNQDAVELKPDDLVRAQPFADLASASGKRDLPVSFVHVIQQDRLHFFTRPAVKHVDAAVIHRGRKVLLMKKRFQK